MLQISFLASLTVFSLSASQLLGRSVFLNGSDVSGARNQSLKNVDLHINENGDILIQAAQYQVNSTETYKPFRKQQVLTQGARQFVPEHKKPTQLSPTQLKDVTGQIPGQSPEIVNGDAITTAPVSKETSESQPTGAEENLNDLEVSKDRLAPKPGSKTKISE